MPATIHWLISRQLIYVEPDDDEDNEDENPANPPMSVLGFQERIEIPALASLSLEETQYVGFNGRQNKEADTCYCFWVVATLKVGQVRIERLCIKLI